MIVDFGNGVLVGDECSGAGVAVTANAERAGSVVAVTRDDGRASGPDRCPTTSMPVTTTTTTALATQTMSRQRLRGDRDFGETSDIYCYDLYHRATPGVVVPVNMHDGTGTGW
jgi:hypothetical protein